MIEGNEKRLGKIRHTNNVGRKSITLSNPVSSTMFPSVYNSGVAALAFLHLNCKYESESPKCCTVCQPSLSQAPTMAFNPLFRCRSDVEASNHLLGPPCCGGPYGELGLGGCICCCTNCPPNPATDGAYIEVLGAVLGAPCCCNCPYIDDARL